MVRQIYGDMITCPICGKGFYMLTRNHIEKEHNMNLDEFSKLYPKYVFYFASHIKCKRRGCNKFAEVDLYCKDHQLVKELDTKTHNTSYLPKTHLSAIRAKFRNPSETIYRFELQTGKCTCGRDIPSSLDPYNSKLRSFKHICKCGKNLYTFHETQTKIEYFVGKPK